MSEPEDADFEEDMREFMDAALEAGPHFQQNLFHPNLFHNIIAGEGIIFQYDNPYDSDDDDYDYFDDDDFFNDDFEVDNCRKIFVTLQDSHVINRLSFHKKAHGHFRSVSSTTRDNISFHEFTPNYNVYCLDFRTTFRTRRSVTRTCTGSWRNWSSWSGSGGSAPSTRTRRISGRRPRPGRVRSPGRSW